jgi:hypothetical protein
LVKWGCDYGELIEPRSLSDPELHLEGLGHRLTQPQVGNPLPTSRGEGFPPCASKVAKEA